MRRLALKVCGLNDRESIATIAALMPDYLGFVFAPASPRCVADCSVVRSSGGIPRVGVFVDASLPEISDAVSRCELNIVQLHGSESIGFVEKLRKTISADTAIWRAFRISHNFPEAELSEFLATCKAFIFDTAGAYAGGNGQVFNWELMPKWIRSEVPFFLSGGIGPENIAAAAKFADAAPAMLGVDVNSRVERGIAGVKDEKLVQLVKERLMSYVT